MQNQNPHNMSMTVYDFIVNAGNDSYTPIEITTSRGTIQGHYYPAEKPQCAMIWVGGAGGGFDSPGHGLYVRLAEELQRHGIASLRIRYRHANHLEECVLDVLAGIHFLKTNEGMNCVGLAGHSFGGAVVIQAAYNSPNVRTVIPLSTQSYGIDPINNLNPNTSLLLMHGRADEVLPPRCSQYAYDLSNATDKHIILLDNTNHGLDQTADLVFTTVRDWILERLK
jgi:alpha/beta superfamily hydrolase